MSRAPRLPAGYVLEAELSARSASERVVRARLDGRSLVVRIAPSEGPERLAELAVLAAIDHPGLARLVDHGVLPGGGGAYLARTWIEGQDLATWSRGRTDEELGRAVARLCPALEHLHRRGFVHGDLKADNAVVTPDGAVVLTDFGLARGRGAEGGDVSGTLFAIAPEVLLGQPPDARSDLFALGVLLHQLLIGRRASAGDFYGRFPAEDFFTATGTRPEELPSWARDVVTGLLERDPGRRPRSAAALGRTLAGRLGERELFEEPTATLAWPAREGREAWSDAWLATLESPGALHWLQLPDREQPGRLLNGLSLQLALKGRPVHRIEGPAELRASRTEAELDRWARHTAEEHAGAVLFLALSDPTPWLQRAVEALARTLCQRRATDAERTPALVVGSPAPAPSGDLEWRAAEVPAVERRHIAAWLERVLIADGERIAGFADLLARAAGGSATLLDQVLAETSRTGWFLAGDERPRLRPGPLPGRLEAGARDAAPSRVEPEAGRLLASLHVLGGWARLREAFDLAGLEGEQAAGAVRDLVGAGLGELRPGGIRAGDIADVPGLPDESGWRALHERRAAQLRAAGATEFELTPHLWRAGAIDDAGALEVLEGLLERGRPELALELAERLRAQARESGRDLDRRLHAARAFAWCALGQAVHALGVLEELDQGPAGRALAERVRARVAVLDHDPARALEHLERARQLEPEDGGETTLARARLHYQLGQDEALLELVRAERATGDPPPAVERRVWNNLRAMEAMSLSRRGQVDRARESLERQVDEARREGDALREAGLCIDLGTLERRSGDTASAIRHLERAAEHYDRAGLLPGLAKARAMLGSLLRDVGQPRRAQELLLAAQAVRERLGDQAGAVAVRGMLGLALADRGHVRPAIEELDRSAAQLRAAGRSRDALLLAARAEELRARLGASAAASAAREGGSLAEGDPRVLVSRAYAAWHAGDTGRALELAERAARLGTSLGVADPRGTIDLLRSVLTHEAPGPGEADGDASIFALLSSGPLDPERALGMARRLEENGSDDRAARVLMACSSRLPEHPLASEIAARAERLFEACSVGLTPAEAEALRGALLGYPDPWPEDLRNLARATTSEEEFEMEVMQLLEINHRLVTQEDLSTLLGTIVEQAISMSGAQRGFLILEEDGELVVDTALDSRRGGIEAPDVEVSGSVLKRALDEGRPVRVSNAVDDPLLGSAPSVVNLELRSILCAPFKVQKGLRGVIYVDHRLQEAVFDERVERLLALLADQAALAIQQVRRVQEIRALNRELSKRVERQASDLATARERLRHAGLPSPGGGLVGDSQRMRVVHQLLERAAQTNLPVLVSGESGTGKELAARALHDLGPRARQAFVSENCAAIPASLIESELFGVRRGAFTGADRDRQGLFERAHGGTLFLDEIGELPLELQAKLLRVLETGEVRRIGDSELRSVDFRLVAATNRDLGREVREERFRADLYYRLDGLRIEMPPLREHAEDIPTLVEHFLRLRRERGEPAPAIARPVLSRLCERDWPGNVRELLNELSRLCVLSDGEIVDPDLVRSPQLSATRPPAGGVVPLAELERQAIEHALAQAGGDKRKAAELLGISRAKIYQRLKEWRSEPGSPSDS